MANILLLLLSMFTCWKKSCNQSACSNRDIMLLASSCTSDRQKVPMAAKGNKAEGRKKAKKTKPKKASALTTILHAVTNPKYAPKKLILIFTDIWINIFW